MYKTVLALQQGWSYKAGNTLYVWISVSQSGNINYELCRTCIHKYEINNLYWQQLIVDCCQFRVIRRLVVRCIINVLVNASPIKWTAKTESDTYLSPASQITTSMLYTEWLTHDMIDCVFIQVLIVTWEQNIKLHQPPELTHESWLYEVSINWWLKNED